MGAADRAALDAGVYLPPAQFEAAFIPATLSNEELDAVIEGIKTALAGF